MMQYFFKDPALVLHRPLIGVICRSGESNGPGSLCSVSLTSSQTHTITQRPPSAETSTYGVDCLSLPSWDLLVPAKSFQAHDIVLIDPTGVIHLLIRPSSDHNSFFVTGRCNNNCLMCSQPPIVEDDTEFWFEVNMQLLELVPQTLKVLGITGGEPTLLGKKLIVLTEKIREKLPSTDVHLLTNGRAFARLDYAGLVAEACERRTVFAIPLYSDYPLLHNYVVQSRNAFSQTVQGIYNLARYDQRIEIRVVLTRQVVPRLPELAEFIYRNMPFVEHVALMGLEYEGYARLNDGMVWIDPEEYIQQLSEAVDSLSLNGLQASIYNLPLCVLPNLLWNKARKSISDWKNSYSEVCTDCSVRASCGGLFESTMNKYLPMIVPVKQGQSSYGMPRLQA